MPDIIAKNEETVIVIARPASQEHMDALAGRIGPDEMAVEIDTAELLALLARRNEGVPA